MKMGSRKTIGFLGILVLIGVWWFGGVKDVPSKPNAVQGYIDVSNWSMETKSVLPLDGEWEFYWMELIEPSDFNVYEDQKEWIYIPTEVTNRNIHPKGLSSDGYATLRLHIRVPDVNKQYGLKLKYFASANKIWINGKPVASSGKVDASPKNAKAQYMPLDVLWISDTEEVEIVIQIANFHHRRICLNTVMFGTADQILNHTRTHLIKESIILGNLILIAVYYGILYWIQKRDRALLYLSLISFCVAIRGSIVSERIWIRLIPDFPPEHMMKLGYLPVFILLPLLALYVKEVFQTSRLDRVSRIYSWFGIFISAIVCLFSVKVYDWIFTYGLWVVILGAIYLICLVLKNGLIQNTRGSYLMGIGGAFVLLGAISDIFRELGFIHTPELLSTGIVHFIVLQAVFLAWRLNDSFEKATELAIENEHMYEEIQALNGDLENKIKRRTEELQIANRQLEEMSKTDALTGLMNRRHFDERLEAEWELSRIQRKPLSILMMDIDFFKEYNDTYGHVMGDECLRKIANALLHSIRQESDLVARYGGEEFVALLPNTDFNVALEAGDTIRKNVKKLEISHKSSGIYPYITLSLGVFSTVVGEADSKEAFIDKADQSLYLAKEKGRDRVYGEQIGDKVCG